MKLNTLKVTKINFTNVDVDIVKIVFVYSNLMGIAMKTHGTFNK